MDLSRAMDQTAAPQAERARVGVTEAPGMDEHRSSDGSVDRASAIAEKSERNPGYAGPTPADLAPHARRAAGHVVRLSPIPVDDGTKTWRAAQCGGESSERVASRPRS
jgi:hypothetical protein